MRTPARRIAILSLVILSLLAVTTSAIATDVRGTLTVPPTVPSLTPDPAADALSHLRYWEEWNGFMDARHMRFDAGRELAVVLTGGEASSGEQPAYRIHNGSLYPATIVARAGTGIQIRNDDGTPYELYAEGLDDFPAVPTAPGNPRLVTVPATPGSWPIHDRLYAHVHGYLHAIPDLVARAFVQPNGAYIFHGVEPGNYELHVYHGDHEVIEARPVTVPPGGELIVPALVVTAPAGGAAAPAAPEGGEPAAAPAAPAPAAPAPAPATPPT